MCYLFSDSSFMYIIAVLVMIKLYQNRHSDLIPSAHSTFMILALIMTIGMYLQPFFVVSHWSSLGHPDWDVFSSMGYMNCVNSWGYGANKTLFSSGPVPEPPGQMRPSGSIVVRPRWPQVPWTKRYQAYGDSCGWFVTDGETTSEVNGLSLCFYETAWLSRARIHETYPAKHSEWQLSHVPLPPPPWAEHSNAEI